MASVQWRALPESERIAIAAFGVHALLLLVDFFAFAGAFGANRAGDRVMPVLRIAVFCFFVVSLLTQAGRPWLVGASAFFAFLIRDVVKLVEIFAGPPLGATQRQLTSALVMSLIVGIGASWWSSAGTLLRRPAD